MIPLLLAPLLLSATDTLQVLNGDVTVQINGAVKTLKSSSIFELHECDTISILNGPGKMKVKNFIFSENTSEKTYKTICKENYFSELAGQLFANNESKKSGVSLRDIKIIKSAPEYHVTKPVDNETVYEKYFYFSKDYLVINNTMLGAKKMKISIQDMNGKVNYVYESNGTVAVFKIDASILNKKSYVKIENIETKDKLLLIDIQ